LLRKDNQLIKNVIIILREISGEKTTKSIPHMRYLMPRLGNKRLS
jgi:hypothetical protein